MESLIAEMEIRRGTPEEYEEIIDFANLAFRIDFKALLPILYVDHPECASSHLLIREQGRLRAMVGSFPREMRVGGTALKARCVGTVSVHPYARGAGYMRALMDSAMREAREEGVDLMMLSGQRQRYEYYGFTPCGMDTVFELNKANRRHCPPNNDKPSFRSLAGSPELLDYCQELYGQREISVRRDFFIHSLRSWESSPYVVLQENGVLGYFTMNNTTQVVGEMCLEDDSQYLNTALHILEWMEDGSVQFVVPPSVPAMAAALNTACESARVETAPNFNVLHYPRVLEAFLTVKAQCRGVMNGTYVIEVAQVGRYKICVEDGEVSVAETGASPDISLPHLSMMRYLFSPLGPQMYQPKPSALERDWFPIPLDFPRQDRI